MLLFLHLSLPTPQVYKMQPGNFLRATGHDFAIDYNLDGLGATEEFTVDIDGGSTAKPPSLPTLYKTKLTIDLPQLGVDNRGVWIVHVGGGAPQLRARLRRGGQRDVEGVGTPGQGMRHKRQD